MPYSYRINRIAALNIDQLRVLWRETTGRPAPDFLSKELIARALAYRLQEQRLGGLDPHLRRLLISLAKPGAEPIRHLKIGSVILREFDGKIHEVTVAPGGFYWSGQTYASLSAIARKITGTSRKGPASLACAARTRRRRPNWRSNRQAWRRTRGDRAGARRSLEVREFWRTKLEEIKLLEIADEGGHLKAPALRDPHPQIHRAQS